MARKPLNVNIITRDSDALELRKAGYSYDEIAKRLEFAHKSGAHHAVKRALAAALKIRDEDAAEMRELETQRLDAMLAGVWPAATQGDTQAITAALKISERRAAFNGLDAPVRRELSGPGGGAIQVEQEVIYSVEERQRRILTFISERTGTSIPRLALTEGSDLDPAGGSTDNGVSQSG